MLEALRKRSGGIVAKVFIAVLVLSFAVWGVADIFRGYRTGTVISVGDTEISAEEFRYAYQTELQRVARQLGHTLSPDEARALQIEERVLGRLVTEATLDNDARNRDLGISTEAVARSIAEDPAFRDGSGRFNKAYFDQLLRANGLSEAAYVEQERRLHLRQQISATLTAGATAPATLVEALHRYREERRAIAYIVLKASALPPLAEPDEAALKKYFEENRADFRLPEFRKFELIEVSPAKLAEKAEVAEEDIVASYEARTADFVTPEKRAVQQIVFPTPEEARTAAEKIAGGADFLAVARERGLSENDVDLGLLAREDIADPAVREAVFSLEKGAVSAPVAGALGTVLVRVTDIRPASTKPLAEARDEIRKALAERQAQDMAFDLYDKVEDERASGASLAEAARKLGLDYRVVEAMDAQGRAPSGAAVADLPQASEVVGTVSENDPGVELDALQTPGGGFVWINVIDIIPARERTFEEARSEVEAGWRKQETRRLLNERADALIARLRAGATLEELSSELGTPLVETQPLQRNATDATLSPAAIQTAFSLPLKEYAVSTHADGTDRVILQPRRSDVPALEPGSEDARRLAEAIKRSRETSLLSQYISARREDFGVSVNRQTLQALRGNR